MGDKLIDIEDAYEDEDCVVMKASYHDDYCLCTTIKTDIGIKDIDGDIIKIVTINSRTYMDDDLEKIK